MTTKERKPRRKATTDVGRQILQRERARLSREQAALGEQLANEARAARMLQDFHKRQVKPEANAISRGLIRRIAAVLASEGVTPAIETHLTPDRMKAYTDFHKIHVTYRMHEDVRLLAATLRGLMYHEGGHIRFTVPWAMLQAKVIDERAKVTGQRVALGIPEGATGRTLQRAWNALEDQRMETAVVSDSPRKAAYFTPVVLTELTQTLDAAAANYPLLVWRRYLPENIRRGARKLFITRHGGGQEAELTAQWIESIVDRYVTATDAETMYAAVVDMEAALRAIKPLAFDLDEAGHSQQHSKPVPSEDWDDALTIPIDPSMLDDDVTDGGWNVDDEDDTEPVFDLTDPEVAAHLAEVFSHLFIDPWNLIRVRYVIPGGAPSNSDEDQGEPGDDGDSEDGGPGDLLGDEDEGDEDDGDLEHHQNASGNEADEDEDLDAEWDDDEDDDDFDSLGTDEDETEDEGMERPESTGGSSGTHTNDGSDLEDDDDEDGSSDLSQDELDEALAEAEDNRLNDSALDGDVDSYNDALDNHTSNLQPYIGGISSDVEAQGQAESLAIEIEQAFQAATIDRAPAWVEGQRRGIVNVQRYATRQAGEHEFFKAWVDDDQPGFDMAVSVLLDYSGSMTGSLVQLAQTAYASKRACEALGIPCTVVLWDTDARTLYDADERVEGLPLIASAGGTDPEHALADLDNQRHDKTKHIVLIMTDGSWDSNWEGTHPKRSLVGYKDESRTIIGFGYESGYNADHLAQNLLNKGCDEAYGITDLMEIPRRLESVLIALA